MFKINYTSISDGKYCMKVSQTASKGVPLLPPLHKLSQVRLNMMMHDTSRIYENA
jgi:hypothetical protein